MVYGASVVRSVFCVILSDDLRKGRMSEKKSAFATSNCYYYEDLRADGSDATNAIIYWRVK